MTSVASKMLMFSYSIDRVTFFFNFFCFVADIFGIFCTLSWVFYHPEANNGSYDTFDSFTVAGQVWITKILSMVALCLLIAFLFAITAAFLTCSEKFCTRGKPKYLQCCPCCSYRRTAHVHSGVNATNSQTSSACDNCKANCIFCCFICKTCCVELCRRRTVNSNVANVQRPQRPKSPCCYGTRIKLKNFSWAKCRGTSCEILIGLLALIALICVAVMAPVAAVFMFGIAVMALEIARLCVITMLFYNLDSDKHRANVQFYKPIFEYLLAFNSKSDYHVRLAIVNYECCWEWAVKMNYIKCSVDEMDSDQKIDANLIRPLGQLSENIDWMKALIIPNTLVYDQQRSMNAFVV